MGDEARILIVCTGNICRSPFIERLLQHSLDESRPSPDARIRVSSAGTGALAGQGMDGQAAAQLVAHGGDPAGFIARDLTAELIEASDLVLTATRAHRGLVALMHPPCCAGSSPSPTSPTSSKGRVDSSKMRA